MPNLSVSVRLSFAALLSVLAGCATGPVENAKQPAVAAPAFKPEISTNQVMVSVIDHNSHFLWNVADKTKASKTDKDWHDLEHAAVTLVASGNMLMMGGPGLATTNGQNNRNGPNLRRIKPTQPMRRYRRFAART